MGGPPGAPFVTELASLGTPLILQGVTFRVEGGELVIARILHGGMVAQQGLLHVGDIIKEVNGQPVGSDPRALQELLRSASGSVILKILPSYQEPHLPRQVGLCLNPTQLQGWQSLLTEALRLLAIHLREKRDRRQDLQAGAIHYAPQPLSVTCLTCLPCRHSLHMCQGHVSFCVLPECARDCLECPECAKGCRSLSSLHLVCVQDLILQTCVRWGSHLPW